MNWYVAVMRRSFDFSGRANRREYWWFVGLVTLFSIVVGAIFEIISPDASTIVSGLFSLVHLVPSLSVGARRLHDTGRSGWWQALGLVPLIGFLVLLVLMLLKGNEGSNRFGEPPASTPADL